MSLLEQAYRQRVEFMKRNLGEPDLVMVPYAQQFEFIGEISVKHMPVIDRNTLNYMGMRVIWVADELASRLAVCMSATKLATGERHDQ